MFAFYATTDAMYAVHMNIHIGIALDVADIMCIGVDVQVVDGVLFMNVLWKNDTV